MVVGSNGAIIYSGLTTLEQTNTLRSGGPHLMAKKPFRLPSKVADGLASETNVVFVDELCVGDRTPILLVIPEKLYQKFDMFDHVTSGRWKMRAKTILLNCRKLKRLGQKQLKVMLPGMEKKLYNASELPAVVEPVPTIVEATRGAVADSSSNTEQREVPNQPQPQASAPSGDIISSQELVHSNPVEQTGENGAAMEVDVCGDGDSPAPEFTAIAVGPEFSFPLQLEPAHATNLVDRPGVDMAFGSPIETWFGYGSGNISTTTATTEELEKELEAALEKDDHTPCVTLSNLGAVNGDATPTTGVQAHAKAASSVHAHRRPSADDPLMKRAGIRAVNTEAYKKKNHTVGSSRSAVKNHPVQQKLLAHIGANSGAGTSASAGQRALPAGGSKTAPDTQQQVRKPTQTKRIGDLQDGFVAGSMARGKDREVENLSGEVNMLRKEVVALKKTQADDATTRERMRLELKVAHAKIACLQSMLDEKNRDDKRNQKRTGQDMGVMDYYGQSKRQR